MMEDKKQKDLPEKNQESVENTDSSSATAKKNKEQEKENKIRDKEKNKDHSSFKEPKEKKNERKEKRSSETFKNPIGSNLGSTILNQAQINKNNHPILNNATNIVRPKGNLIEEEDEFLNEQINYPSFNIGLPKKDKTEKEGPEKSPSILENNSKDKENTSKNKKLDVSGELEVSTIIKKALPFVLPALGVILFVIIITAIAINSVGQFNPLLGINSETGEEIDDEEEYQAETKEEKEFYERVKKVTEEYEKKNDTTIDAQLIVATVVIIQNYNEKLDFDDFKKSDIEDIINAMFKDDENKEYDQDTFEKNLISTILPKYIKNRDESSYKEIAKEIFDYNDAYEELTDKKELLDNFSGICIDGVIKAAQLAKMSPEEYINLLGPVAQRDYSRTGIFASVTLAQSIIESNWGKSGLSLLYNNMFGIKCDPSWKGKCINMGTTEEYSPGSVTSIIDGFRVYNSVDESFYDHSKFLKDNSRYREAGVFSAKNAREQIAAIKRGGYATASNYVSTITSVMDTYNLEKWDVTVNTNTSGDECLGGTSSTSGGWNIRTVAPTAKDKAFNLKNDNRGQCVWYAQARAIEAAMDLADKKVITKEQYNKIKNQLLNVYANAGDWYSQAVVSGKFNGSMNIKDVKAGSIIVWSKANWYGHVAFIENVDKKKKTITITEGWATNTNSCPNSWGCVNFNSTTMSLSTFYNSYGKHYSGAYNFVGYVYALEPKG